MPMQLVEAQNYYQHIRKILEHAGNPIKVYTTWEVFELLNEVLNTIIPNRHLGLGYKQLGQSFIFHHSVIIYE